MDIEYRFRFAGSGVGRVGGIANRTDFDLTTHGEHSGVDLSYFDQATGERWVPYVIEPAAGLTRCVLAFLLDAYDVDSAPNAKGRHGHSHRAALRPAAGAGEGGGAAKAGADLSPVARDPPPICGSGGMWTSMTRGDRPTLPAPGRDRHTLLRHGGLRLLQDRAVTVRERDSMAQERIGMDALQGWLASRLPAC